jgi:hypothetical protein
MIKDLNKTRPFFGGSVTQNTQGNHDHKLENFTGVGLKKFKKAPVIAQVNKPNSSLANVDFTREQDFPISTIRNNELPFKQIHVGRYENYQNNVLNDKRYMSEIQVKRQNLKGFVPSKHSQVRKPALIDGVYTTKKEVREIISHQPGKVKHHVHFSSPKKQVFRESSKKSKDNIIFINKVIPLSKKVPTPIYKNPKHEGETVHNFTDRHFNLHKLNSIQPTYKNYNKTITNTESNGGISYPVKFEYTPNLPESKRTEFENNRTPIKFLNYETFTGNGMSFTSKEKTIVKNNENAQSRAFKVNNEPGSITSVKESKKNITLGGAQIKNDQNYNIINSVSGNKRVHNMEEVWLRTLPKRVVHINGINIKT